MNLKNMMGMGLVGGLARDPLAFSPIMMVKRAMEDEEPQRRRPEPPKPPSGQKVPDVLNGGLAGMMLRKRGYL
jgi:hypothetical protein